MESPRTPLMRMRHILLSLLLVSPVAALHAADSNAATVPSGSIAQQSVTREVTVEHRYLHFPVKAGAKKCRVAVSLDGQKVRWFEIELADGTPDWWAPLDISEWKGKKLTVVAEVLPAGSKALDDLRQVDEIVDSGNLYREPLRPQLQFSSRRGWLNDPNGLVFYNGEYHLFYQHNPYGCTWGNMHWGHAVSADMIHWKELGEALSPDLRGIMASGSAVVDWKNTSGFGTEGKPPMVVIYSGNAECLASSTDGRTFTKYTGNPVIKQLATGPSRDPKIFWHEGRKEWVCVLYAGLPNPTEKFDEKGKKCAKHTVHFFTSPNLRDWTLASITEGGVDGERFLYECPDFFELPVDGNPAAGKWVLTGADGDYMIGSFDGKAFTAESSRIKGIHGKGFYAAQTFSDMPDGRCVQMGWHQAPSPGMPFNQLLTFPCELRLLSTPEGPRLARAPIKGIESLRSKSVHAGPMDLREGAPNPLASVHGELLEIRADFTPPAGSVTTLSVRGIDVSYDASKQELTVEGKHVAPAPLRNGKQSLILLVDRTNITLWASDGLSYVVVPVIPKPEDLSVGVSVKGGPVKFTTLDAFELKSIWEKPQTDGG